MDNTTRPASNTPILAWTGLTLVLLLVCLRATSQHVLFPWWDSDPFTFLAPSAGMTPALGLGVDLLTIVSSALCVLGVRRAGGRVPALPAALVLLGGVWVLMHAWMDLETLPGGASTLAAVCAGAACWHATQLPKARGVIAGVTLGLIALLVLVGLHQMYIQHPRTVALYQDDRLGFLQSQGWAPDSFQARTYERRLMQPEPTAWFGLSNVYASLVGAMGLGLLMLSEQRRRGASVALFAFAGLGGLGLVFLSGSTGAVGAVALGAALVTLAAKWKRCSTGQLVLIGCLLVLLGVVARGIIGEGLGERSLLFRWQYLVGSWRAWLEHPVSGVGSGHFQEAYARLKPALSPEDAASPHSVGVALITNLGLGGMAMVGLLGAMAWSIGRPRPPSSRVDSPDQRGLARVIGAVVLVSMALSIRLESGVTNLELIGVQVLGAGLWAAVAWMVATRAHESAARWAMGGAAAVLLVHGQIDLAPTFVGSAGLVWAMIGGAGTIAPVPDEGGSGGRRGLGGLGVGAWGAVVLVGCGLAARGLAIVRWESSISRGGEAAHLVAIERQRGVVPMGELYRREYAARVESRDALAAGLAQRPGHAGTRIALCTQDLWLGSDAIARGDLRAGDRFFEAGQAAATEGLDQPGMGADRLRWGGTFLAALADRFPDDPESERWRRAGLEYWARAYERTPHDPDLAVMLMDGYLALGEMGEAGRWGERALAAHGAMRLDPLRQLDDSTLDRVRGVVGR